MPVGRFDRKQETHLAALLRKAVLGFDSTEDSDHRLIDDAKVRHPGLSHGGPAEAVSGESVPERWLNVIILRGVQLMVAARGFDVLMLGGLEAPFIVMHRHQRPLAVQAIPPDTELLFAPDLAEEECQAVFRVVDEANSVVLRIFRRVGKEAPIAGDLYAERVWRTCRVSSSPPARGHDVDPRRVNEVVQLSHGRPWLQKFEMVLALSERVLVGKDKPLDRQTFAAAAHLLWNDIGSIDWSMINVPTAIGGGHIRVASLASQEDGARQEFLDLVTTSMPLISADEPVDIKIANGSTLKVYRFHAGKRTLIDRLGGRRGRVH